MSYWKTIKEEFAAGYRKGKEKEAALWDKASDMCKKRAEKCRDQAALPVDIKELSPQPVPVQIGCSPEPVNMENKPHKQSMAEIAAMYSRCPMPFGMGNYSTNKA